MRDLLRRLFNRAKGGAIAWPTARPGDIPFLLADGRVWTRSGEGDWLEHDLSDPANGHLARLNEGSYYRASIACTCVGKRQGDRHSVGCPIGPRSTLK